jgi:hypothetical protein
MQQRKRARERGAATGWALFEWVVVSCTNLAMDLEFNHPTDIYSLRPCRNTDAPDIVAIGGEHSVEVIQVVSIFFFFFLNGNLDLLPTVSPIRLAISSRLSMSGRVLLP